MKKMLIVLLLLLPALTYAQNWQWANAATYSDTNSMSSTLTVDLQGKVYVAGYFSSDTLMFNSFTITNPTHSSHAMYMVKYDSSGNVLWAKNIGENGGIVNAVADNFGNVYVAGNFSTSTMNFGTDTLINGSEENMFLTKFDSSGNFVWARCPYNIDTTMHLYNCVVSSVSTDLSGNVFITGDYNSGTRLVFGSDSLDTTGLFIVKYDSSGNVSWGKSSESGEASSIKTDTNGNVFVTGIFSGSMNFGSITITCSSPDFGSIFLVKFGSSGNALWAVQASPYYNTNCEPGIVTTDLSGNAYISGNIYVAPFQYPPCLMFFGNDTVTTEGSNYVAKYSSSGGLIYVKSIVYVNSLSTDKGNNLLIAGSFDPPYTTFGTSDTLTSNSGIYLTKFDSSGNIYWAISPNVNTINADNWASSVTNDSYGNIYVSGNFESQVITFGSTSLTESSNSFYSEDMFIAKVNDGGIVYTNIPSLIKKDNDFLLYPNPCINEITIIASDNITNISITNLLGQTVFIQDYYSTQVQIDISFLPSDVYVVTVNGSAVKEFVKQ